MKARTYYFCSTHMTFSHDCQLITQHEGDDLKKLAETWARTNGYQHVYVYDMNHNFVWSYDF